MVSGFVSSVALVMSYKTLYGGVIWTNHAIEKMRDRGLSQDKAFEAFKHPDKTFPAKKPHALEFRKRFNGSFITVIALQNEKNEWVVISAWIDPPVFGSKDYKERKAYKRYQKASGFMKIVLTIKNQIGS